MEKYRPPRAPARATEAGLTDLDMFAIPFRIAAVRRARSARALCLLCAVGLNALPAQAGSEIQPGEFIALPAGTQVASVYQYERDLEGYYFSGERSGDAEVRGRASVFAYTRYGEIKGMTSAWSVMLPYIQAHKTTGTLPGWFGDRASGFSDLRLKYTVWPINDPARGRYLALSGVWQPDTGRYENAQVLSPGDNRNRFTFQIAWIEALTQTVSLELIPEISLHGDNKDYVGAHMEQERAYALTGYLRWRFSGPWTANIGFQSNGGGDQIIDGVRQHNQPDQQRILLGVNTLLAPNVSASLRYSHDLSVENSLRILDDWVLALHYFF